MRRQVPLVERNDGGEGGLNHKVRLLGAEQNRVLSL